MGLADAGFNVDWVTNGKGALGDGVYDLVLLDLRLPGKDGMSLLRDLRAPEPESATCPCWPA